MWAPSLAWSRAILTQSSQHGIAELLRPVGVGPLADRQEGGVLPERHVLVERGGAGLRPRPALGERAAVHAFDDLPQVLGGGAAAAADEREAEIAGEVVVGV